MTNDEIRNFKDTLMDLSLQLMLMRSEYSTTAGRMEANIDDIKTRLDSLEREIYGIDDK